MAVALQAERTVIEKKKPDIKQRRVVVTDKSVVTQLGHVPDVFYNNLLDGVRSNVNRSRATYPKYGLP